ncbi:hypothetical protein Veis_4346 [Verminephrobacter eiseniae EF01-2]|uniref:Phage-related protein n=1 Tax=Verminephrobacter eiseniae (strain EF01-2) TaxID=391735 RepID=A1WQZ2_VEREI|nr:hypothetical protein Veis_4346 [Verminephrobacter eiseniae EF01-2]
MAPKQPQRSNAPLRCPLLAGGQRRPETPPGGGWQAPRMDIAFGAATRLCGKAPGLVPTHSRWPWPRPACVGPGGRIRIICVANAVCVLAHCQQNTEKTSNVDLDLAAKRYRGALKEPGQ